MAGTVLTLVGIAAITVGLGLIVAPDGDGFKLSVELLKNTPFRDYLIPGIVLLTVIGVGSLLAAIPAFKLHRFAGAATLLLGLALVLFIVAQVYWIGTGSGLLPILMIVGIVEMGLGVLIIAVDSNHQMFHRHHNHHAH